MGNRRGKDASGPPRQRSGSPRNTGYPFRKKGDRRDALWRSARGNGDEDGDAGALRAPAYPQHRGDAGGRKLPPPTVGGVSFFLHNHGVEVMPVHKVHPHLRPCCHFPQTPLHGACMRSPLFRKRNPVFLGDPALGRGGPLASSPRRFPMTSHQMTQQGANRQLFTTLLTLYLIPLPFSVRVPLPRNPLPVRRCSDVSRRLAGVVYHANCLPDISLQAHLVKQAYQGVKCALDSDRVRRGNHAVVGIKKRRLVPPLLS